MTVIATEWSWLAAVGLVPSAGVLFTLGWGRRRRGYAGSRNRVFVRSHAHWDPVEAEQACRASRSATNAVRNS